MAELVSKRYAHALFEAAKEEGALDFCASEFNRFMSLYQEAEHLFLESALPKRKKEQLLDTMQLEGLVHSFVRLLLQKGRLELVRDMKAEFDMLLDEDRGVARAFVTSAIPLNDVELKMLQSNLEKTTGLSLEITCDIDERIIGGLVIRIKDRVLDCSVKSKLENMLKCIQEIK